MLLGCINEIWKKHNVVLACFSCYEPKKYEDIDGRCDRLEPLC